MTALTVIVPLFNERESLPELKRRLFEALDNPALPESFGEHTGFEVIMVDDGSTDGSADLVREMITERPEIRLISFRRNYGKTAALSAGFRAASGEMVITMDADLQDDPGEFRPLLMKLREGYDMVSGWKLERKDPLSKTLPSKLFNSSTRLFSGIPLHDFNCGLKAYRRRLVASLDLHGEMHRYIPVIAHWNGYRVTEMPVRHHPRKYGKSKFGAARFFAGLFDFLSVMFITRYLRRPMHFFGMMGLGSFMTGLLISLYVTLDKLMNHRPVSNRPILFLGILLIILGVQLFSTGLLGEMLSTRPARSAGYAVRETANLDEEIVRKLEV
ncbi:MAG: glycosyltransferase family 2 protein [Chlorobiaceae bacterium]|nr:glycosyltransferase family 2 protein [Chlorobiaceae bacterium]NTW73972.1 glycosyltransferase family 2 protein [Chlorobiaceae bacterium]